MEGTELLKKYLKDHAKGLQIPTIRVQYYRNIYTWFSTSVYANFSYRYSLFMTLEEVINEKDYLLPSMFEKREEKDIRKSKQ